VDRKLMEKISWCLKNYIFIYPHPTSKGRKPLVNIYINSSGKIKKGKEIYTQDKVHLKIYELYDHIYDKLN
jgi:predicted amidohydrolase